jgi:hypothetical protein
MRPSSASWSCGILLRSLPRARPASRSGLSSPLTIASNIACPLLPMVWVTVLASLMLALSSSFWMRLLILDCSCESVALVPYAPKPSLVP